MHIEKDILSLIGHNPEKAIAMMYDNYYTYLSMVVYRLLKDDGLTKDIIQAVFIDIWKKKSDLNIKSSLKQYLGRAAVNKSLNHIRSNKRVEDDSAELINLNSGEDYDHSYQMEADEMNERIVLAIEELPERCRLVFTLSRFEEMTYKQIAEELDISTKTVENQMTKALKLMRYKIKYK